ncbi:MULTISPECIES: hypothetical protein [Deefgea]|uniref:Secreted protein n=1 Tax=Deefgea chitinilytica TaxID=570276 RepID=A0ABS2CDC6_9NEIS|nr:MULTISPECIES: hypothetical protein [Deefgea]MBM5572146.1 hypothetical protein [Deefgea chitinilytica]MBM9889381.1 hypothetical protein [Deefgea sp. CFH1-16]
MMRLFLVLLLLSPIAFSKNIVIRCNISATCGTQWQTPLDQTPPQLILHCQNGTEMAKMTITREPQWQRISYDF